MRCREIVPFPPVCMKDWVNNAFFGTVEPVSNGPVLSRHPLVSRRFSKSRFFANTDPVFITCIMRPPCSRPSMSHSDDTRVLLGIFCFILFAMTN